jgi:ribosomal-protein-alanine N-acetyltransferase
MSDFDSKFSVRPASEEDLETICSIEFYSYPTPWTKNAFIEEMNKPFSNVIVMTDDETDSIVSGYIVFWIMFEECHILNVTVNREWRGLGYGVKLVRLAIDQALRKNCKKVILEVRKSNEAAIELYQKLGFFTESIKKNFYSDSEDAIFMAKFLEKENQF